jgi:hypothetical protein
MPAFRQDYASAELALLNEKLRSFHDFETHPQASIK